MDKEELNVAREKLKEEILDILQKQNYVSELTECPMSTLKFLLKMSNNHLNDSEIYDALCELVEEDKIIKGFESSAGTLTMRINTSRWYLKQ